MPLMLLAAYATGITLVCFIAPANTVDHVVITGFLLLSWVLLRNLRWAWIPVLCLLLLAGFLHASLQLKPPSAPDHIARFADTSAMIYEGKALTIEKRHAGGYRLLVEMLKVIKGHGSTSVSGKILVYIKDGELTVKPGQIVRWRSRLRRPLSFGNPGEFDYPLYLAARGVHVTAFTAHAEDLVVLVNHADQEISTIENWRQTIAAQIEQTVPEDAVGLVQSLLLGMRGGISDEQRQILAEGGVAHLFAISGLHFGLLALLLYQLGKWLYTRSQRLILWCPPQRLLPLLLIMPLAAYLMLTGNAWATRRAFLMVSVAAWLFACNRRTSPVALLATVAFCLLLINPLALFQPGFQLSFAGVTGIIAWLPGWQKALKGYTKLVRWPLTMMMTTAAATLATAPATLWHFHQFSPAGLLANLVAIPLIAWGAVPVGLISLATLPWAPLLANWGLLLSAKLVMLTVSVAASVSHWPGLAAVPCYLTNSRLVLIIGGMLILLPFGSKMRHWCFRLIILLTAVSVAWWMQPQNTDLKITAISVGQGDATLVSLSDDTHYLVDGGGLPGSSLDPGERLVAPALGRMGIDRLDGVILTHNHPDHSSGLTFIMQRFSVDAFYFAGEIDRLAPELQQVLQRYDVDVHQIESGWTHLRKSQRQSFSLFAPSQHARDRNERSVAVYVGQQTQGALLTADLGRSGLQQLIDAGVPGPVSLLKLPHHGSRHAQPGLYLEWAKPSAAFVSSGHGNSYGFPHQQTIEACKVRKIPLFRTDQLGMLTFRINQGKWQAESEKGFIIDSFQGVW